MKIQEKQVAILEVSLTKEEYRTVRDFGNLVASLTSTEYSNLFDYSQNAVDKTDLVDTIFNILHNSQITD